LHDVAPVVLGFDYEANNVPAGYKLNTSAIQRSQFPLRYGTNIWRLVSEFTSILVNI